MQEKFNSQDLLKQHEVNLTKLRSKMEDTHEESNYSEYLVSYKQILKACVALNKTSKDASFLERLALAKAECQVQMVRLTQLTSSSERATATESFLKDRQPWVERALKAAEKTQNREVLDYIKLQWAANLWTIGNLYCENELPKYTAQAEIFKRLFEKTKAYFDEANKYYADVRDCELRNGALQSRKGVILRTVRLYEALADGFYSAAESGAAGVRDNLETAASLYQSALSALGNQIKNKSHTQILVKICAVYRKKAEVFTLAQEPKESLVAVHRDIIAYANCVEHQTKVAQQVMWDHKLKARSYLFASLCYLFEQEGDNSKHNTYGARLVSVAQGLLEFYFSYAAGLLEKNYSKTLVDDHEAAKRFLDTYGKVDFVRQEAVTETPSEALQRLTLSEVPVKRPAPEAQETKEAPKEMQQATSPARQYKRLKPFVARPEGDKENAHPNTKADTPSRPGFFDKPSVSPSPFNPVFRF